MKNNIITLTALVLVLFFGNPAQAHLLLPDFSSLRYGAGIQYWTAVDDVDEEGIDDDSIGFIISFQWLINNAFTLETDLGHVSAGYAGSSDYVLTPEVYLLYGRTLYAGVGTGINYSDSEFADPFYAVRVGVNFKFLNPLNFDVYGVYRFDEWSFDGLEESVSTDTILLGAVLRVEF